MPVSSYSLAILLLVSCYYYYYYYCLKNDKVKKFFPINDKIKITRNPEHYKVNFARTKRFGNSTIPTLQRLLNSEELKKKFSLRNYGC